MKKLVVLSWQTVPHVGIAPHELSRSSANTASADFWIAYEHLYPILSKVVLDLIAAPASQAYTERVFSVSFGDMTSGKRNRLAARLERRKFLKMNAKYLNILC